MPWALLVATANRESGLAKLLKSLDIPCHWFRESRQCVWRGRLIDRPRSLFPGYLFVPLDLGPHGFELDVAGLLRRVRIGNKLATVSDVVIDTLVTASVNDILPVRQMTKSRFITGDLVRISGANVLAGQIGRFVRQLAPNQAVVEVEWMGRWVSIPIDDREIEPLGKKQPKKRRRPPRYIRRDYDRPSELQVAV